MAAVANQKSYYRHGQMQLHTDGGKTLRLCHGLINPTTQSHISNYVENCDGSETIMYLSFDFDFDKALRKWFTEDGSALDYAKIIAFIKKEHPELAIWLLSVCTSSGGKGFALTFGISPFKYDDKATKSAEWLYNMVQRWMYRIFKFHGFGCDPNALGLKRQTMNWRNPDYRVWFNNNLYHYLNDKNLRSNVSVLSEMFNYLSKHSIIAKGEKERWSDPEWPLETVYPDQRNKGKIASLIIDIVEEGFQLELSVKELQEKYGLSKNFIYSKLKDANWPKHGLRVESSHGSWLFSLEDIWSDAISLAYIECTDFEKSRDHVLSKSVEFERGISRLKPPEEVVKGERNSYLTDACLDLKHEGTAESEAYRLLKGLAERIPGHESSKNCKEVDQKVRSIYRNKPKTLGCNPGCAAYWVKNPFDIPIPISRKSSEQKASKQIPLNTQKVILFESFSDGDCLSERQVEKDDNPLLVLRRKKREENLNLLTRGFGGTSPAASTDGISTEASVEEEVRPTCATGLEDEKAAKDKQALGLIASLFPKAAEAITTGRITPEQSKEVVALRSPSQPASIVAQKPLKLTLSEARKKAFMDRNALDRFIVSYERCVTSRTESQVLNILTKVHQAAVRGRITRADCLGKGNPYRRVVRAFLVMGEWMRCETLIQLSSR